MKSIYVLLVLAGTYGGTAIGQSLTEILGRPTNSSITMSILFDQDVDVYWEYGIASGIYSKSTNTVKAQQNVPLEFDFIGLTANTRYFYRTRYRTTGSSVFLAGQEHSFQMPRPAGSSYTFAIEADPHLDENSILEAYQVTLQNILSQKPDFLFDLGDTFMSEKQPIINQEVITSRHILYRPLFGSVCHSSPLFLVIGNHEGELGWKLDGTANSMPVMASNTRKLYYPNPLPNLFYSGDTNEEPFVGLRENYYAFTWGDVLYVVLDPFWYTLVKPDWGWTLGLEQYNWFKKTLSESSAKFKFVFCHNLVGGNGNDARGGTEFVDLSEMGGNNLDGSYGWNTFRPDWEKPIHALMVENKVNIFFHGHDHFFGLQEKDGIIYQEVPQPSNTNIKNTTATEYGYVDGIFLPGRGYLRMTVSPENVKVEYIRSYLPSEENASRKNGEVAYSYTVSPLSTSVGQEKEIPASPELEQNFPNPFNQETTIKYELAQANQVELEVFDLMGKKIATLVNQYQQPGTYSASFCPTNKSIPNGMYCCRFIAGNSQKSIKMFYSAKL